MYRFRFLLSVAGTLLLGYLLGSFSVFFPLVLSAEGDQKKSASQSGGNPGETPSSEEPQGPSTNTLEKIKTAYDALKDAAEALQKEGYYLAATDEVNVFGVLSGGVNAIADLQSGNGVDPETFAAIYAGTIKQEVRELLQRDTSNRYTYNGKLVQMYPVSELRRRYLFRAQLTGQAIRQPNGTDTEGEKSQPKQ